jgi:glycerate kinase
MDGTGQAGTPEPGRPGGDDRPGGPVPTTARDEFGPTFRVVAAPDKFRGTATAAQVAAAVATGVERVAPSPGWEVDQIPMADGGEGTLDAVGGAPRHTVVPGPFGRPVRAEWRLLAATGDGTGPTAVIEMARAAGRDLVPHPTGDDPVRAGTAGVGHLVLAAVDAGARRVVVAVGGSATTDGGWGAVEAIGDRGHLDDVELVVACDVRTGFEDAAAVFGPQKGATPDQVVILGRRLAELADRYRRTYGVDVDAIPGAGAAGGLAGGLAALGARLVPGCDLIAGIVGLPGRLADADLVVTGEGRLDPPSLEGKVVGTVVSLVAGRSPVLCVVGDAEPATAARLTAGPGQVEVVALSERYGPGRARRETGALIADVVAEVAGRSTGSRRPGRRS